MIKLIQELTGKFGVLVGPIAYYQHVCILYLVIELNLMAHLWLFFIPIILVNNSNKILGYVCI